MWITIFVILRKWSPIIEAIGLDNSSSTISASGNSRIVKTNLQKQSDRGKVGHDVLGRLIVLLPKIIT